MALYVIETLSQFKHKFLIEAESPENAQTIWQQQTGNDDFHEASQEYLGEMDIGCRLVQDPLDEVDDYLQNAIERITNRAK